MEPQGGPPSRPGARSPSVTSRSAASSRLSPVFGVPFGRFHVRGALRCPSTTSTKPSRTRYTTPPADTGYSTGMRSAIAPTWRGGSSSASRTLQGPVRSLLDGVVGGAEAGVQGLLGYVAADGAEGPGWWRGGPGGPRPDGARAAGGGTATSSPMRPQAEAGLVADGGVAVVGLSDEGWKPSRAGVDAHGVEGALTHQGVLVIVGALDEVDDVLVVQGADGLQSPPSEQQGLLWVVDHLHQGLPDALPVMREELVVLGQGGEVAQCHGGCSPNTLHRVALQELEQRREKGALLALPQAADGLLAHLRVLVSECELEDGREVEVHVVVGEGGHDGKQLMAALLRYPRPGVLDDA